MNNPHAFIYENLPGLKDVSDHIRAIPSRDDRRMIMMADEGSSATAPVDQLLRELYAWAIITRSSDIHIEGRGPRDHPVIFLHIRTPTGIKNFRFKYGNADVARRWQIKLFDLTGTPQGATTPEIASTRFDLSLPEAFAQQHELKMFDDADSYDVDVRVEYKKLFNGYGFITRLLDPQRAPTMDGLHLPYCLKRSILNAIYLPSGLILTTGPTGSGKTTLQNAMTQVRNDGSCVIETIEEPVELSLRSFGAVRQVQVGGDITFPRALRSSLRSDPDIIVIGEIRDLETLDIALKAAATGHIVLATLHTNDAIEAFTRMLDLAPPDERADYAYRIAANVRLVLAQRLLDSYHGEAVERKLNGTEREWLQVNGMESGPSITEVPATGDFRAKVPLIEAVVMTPEIQRLLRARNVDSSAIYRVACEQLQFEPLAVGGIRAVQSHGVALRESMYKLEGNMEAQSHPGLRLRLARERSLSLQAVSDALDAYQLAIDNGDSVELEMFLPPSGDTPIRLSLEAEAA